MTTFENNGTTYFTLPLDKLVPGKLIDFPLCVYMPLNKNVVVLFAAPRVLTEADLNKYRQRGLKTLVCPYGYHPQWLRYLESLRLIENEATVEQARDAFENKKLSQDDKRKILSSTGDKILKLLTNLSTGDAAQKRKALAECQEVTNEIINVALQSHKDKKVYEDLVLLRDEEIAHSGAVSTVAVIFALVMGFTDPAGLADISLGALLHDLGQSNLNLDIFGKPRVSLTLDETHSFEEHTRLGTSVIEDLGEDVPTVVRQIIAGHHERYDGKGFPSRLVGFQIDERIQIVSLADNVEDLMSGQLTGVPMDPLESLKWIKEHGDVAQSSSVSPEIFEAIYQTVFKTKPTELVQP